MNIKATFIVCLTLSMSLYAELNKGALFLKLDQACDGHFDERLELFLADSHIDIHHKLAIKDSIYRGSLIIKRINNAKHGENISPKPTERDRALKDLDWFFRAITIIQGQEFVKGSMKIPDPDGKLALYILNSTGSLFGKENDPYERPNSHWERQHQDIATTTFNLNKVGLYQFAGSELAWGFDYDEQSLAGLPIAGRENRTIMIMLLPERDESDQEHLHVGFKSEGHSTRGACNAIFHAADWFNKKILKNEDASIYKKIRKEDKLPPIISAEFKKLKSMSGFSKYTDDISLPSHSLGSDISLRELDAYLINCQQNLLVRNLLAQLQQVRDKILQASIQETLPQVLFMALNHGTASNLNLLKSQIDISLSQQVFGFYESLGLPTPSTLTDNTEVLLPSLDAIQSRFLST